MEKLLWVSAMATLVIVSMVWNPVSASEEEMCVPMGEIHLTSLSADAQRAAVAFPHAAHFGYDCNSCHHKWNMRAPISGCMTAGCHDAAEAPKDKAGRPLHNADQRIKYYKEAFHQMCIGCHKTIERQNRKIEATRLPTGRQLAATGPTSCIQCHPKE
ncbi:MAG: cytochrome c3 family protein [Desulfatitalea sp.]|nr:cytochrome c3 family protein [Desulfatitalea sp.]NNK02564.1 cytochrome c3 family protein [Desulfatitalea sp.]